MARPRRPRKEPRLGRPRRTRVTRRRRPWGQLAVVAAATLAVLAVGLWLVAGNGSGPPGTSSAVLPEGPVAVAGLEAPQPVANLGTVPLDTPVRAEYVVRNAGDSTVTLGTLGIEVLEGC